MTMQRIENWSTVRGRVRAVADDPDRADFRRVSVDVEGVEPVSGFAAALEPGAAGTTVEVAVPRETTVSAGDGVEMQVRSTPRGMFAHPDKTRVVG